MISISRCRNFTSLPAAVAACLFCLQLSPAAGHLLDRVEMSNHAPPPAQQQLAARLAPLLHQNYDAALGERIVDEIISHYQSHDIPVVMASVAPDAFQNGTLTVLVSEGRVGQISQQGGRHLSPFKPHIRSGEFMTGTALQRELDWLNGNPFHQATMAATPGDTPDIANLEFTLPDRWPVAAWTNFSNDGVKPLGENRWLAGLSVGDLFKLDQILTLQGQMADDFELYHAALGEWKWRFPWRHELTFNGAYVETESPPTGGVTVAGDAWFAGGRYAVPWRSSLQLHGETWLGLDAKHFDTDVFFGGETQLRQPLDITTISLGSRLHFEHSRDRMELSMEAVWSPGDDFGSSSDPDFSEVSPGAGSSFFYARGSATWTHSWDSGWTLISLVAGQWADGPLAPSEAFYLAGANAVRGYRERSIIGAKGLRGSLEMRAPAVEIPFLPQAKFQPLCFADAGHTWTEQAQTDTPVSAGIGIRAGLGNWGQVRCEGTWPLTDGLGPRLLLNVTLYF